MNTNLALNQENTPPPIFTFKGNPINNKKVISPLKILIHGYNGVGKSTLASQSKNPIFMDLEGNIDHIPVDKQSIVNHQDVVLFLDALIKQEHNYKTLVVDSLDKLEFMINERINSLPDNETSYGKGAKILSKEINDFISKLNLLRSYKNMNIVIIAHSTINKHENPLTKVYDKYELRVSERVGGPISDWCQCILFAVNDVSFEKVEKIGFKERERAKTTDRRILYTSGNTAFVAKNVFDLPSVLPMDWEQLTKHIIKYYEK